MASRKIQGYEMLLELGGGKLGCLTSVSLDLARAIIDASCRETGNFAGGVKGRLSGSITFDGLVIIDDPVVAGNTRTADLIDIMLDDSDTEVSYVYGPGTNDGEGMEGAAGDIAGSKILSGNAILTGLTVSGDNGDGMATYSGTLTLTSKPVHAPLA